LDGLEYQPRLAGNSRKLVATPGGTQGLTDFGRSGYGAPCPPSGIHRYFLQLYALDTTLEVSRGLKKKDLEGVMQGHVLAEGQLIGLYTRKK
jgi:Raf kinase inhibitor-like YbhB/YbcL family protein